MYTKVEKSKENKSRSVTNSVTQKKGNVQQGFGFMDNRPEAAAQLRIGEMLRNSPPTDEVAKMKEVIQNSSRSTLLKEKIENSEAFTKPNFSMVPIQRLEIFSTDHFANPEGYMAQQYPGSEINEDAGSGGILDRPIQNLVLTLARLVPRLTFAAQLRRAGGAGSDLAASLENDVYDRASAHTWVVQNSLAISGVAPTALTVENVLLDDAPPEEHHTFHRDHGKVVLTESALKDKGINSAQERTSRARVANGPGGHGWVRGHYGVTNKRHRFIEHIHIDKDRAEEEQRTVYNAASANAADAFNINDRTNFSEANDGRALNAAQAVEGEAKRLAWETYEQTLPQEQDYY